MKPMILYSNYREGDPTKRLKLAGVRRYAAAAGWCLARSARIDFDTHLSTFNVPEPMPAELVRDYTVEALHGDAGENIAAEKDNGSRLRPEDNPFPIEYEIEWIRLWRKDGEKLWKQARK